MTSAETIVNHNWTVRYPKTPVRFSPNSLFAPANGGVAKAPVSVIDWTLPDSRDLFTLERSCINSETLPTVGWTKFSHLFTPLQLVSVYVFVSRATSGLGLGKARRRQGDRDARTTKIVAQLIVDQCRFAFKSYIIHYVWSHCPFTSMLTTCFFLIHSNLTRCRILRHQNGQWNNCFSKWYQFHGRPLNRINDSNSILVD